jgi:hypothetical protein
MAALLVLCACPGPTPSGDAGTDAGAEVTEIRVAGTVTLFPAAAPLLADAGVTFSPEGLTLRVEEPLKVALNDPSGVFGTVTLGADGAFSVAKVPTDLVNLGIAAGVRDTQDGGRVVPSATTLYDVALAMEKPRGDLLGTTGYAVPTRFHDALTAAITPARIKQLTASNGMKGTLLEAGFILGRVVDANGAPLAGVTITPTQATLQPAFFYPTADLTSTGAATSSNGLFVYVHNGGDVLTFRFSVANRPEYKQRNAGATKEACLVVTVAP